MNNELLMKQREYLAENFSNSTIMVSGSTGLIGSGVVRYLLSLNDFCNAAINIVALYRDDQKKERIYKNYLGREDLSFCYENEEPEITVDFDVDYIIHASGISGGSKMHLKDPAKIFSIGIDGTKRLLDYAVKHNCKGFLLVSTYEIYGSVDSNRPITEEHECLLDTMVLRNSYAEVKRTCESLMTMYNAKYQLCVYSARISPTFGYGVDYNDPRFFAEFGRCVVEKRDIILKSRGETIRNYLDVDDAASAFLYILASGETNNAYNVTTMENAFSIKDIAEQFIQFGSCNKIIFEIDNDTDKLGFRKEGCTLIDAHKIMRLQWKPVWSFEETVEKTINYMKETYNSHHHMINEERNRKQQ